MASSIQTAKDIVNLFSDNKDFNFSAEKLMNVDLIEKHVLRCLKRNFGFVTFRQLQWKIISAIIDQKQDVLAVMATGYGKSLCFQFPSVYLNTVTLIVSPLISLMEDQILSLKLSNIQACMLGSAQNDRTVFQSALEGEYRLVYLTPEFLTGDLGMILLERLGSRLSLIAIDEAHCISQWGHDFRAAFRKLEIIRRAVPHVPILALTATATAQVREDIKTSLKMRNALEVCTGFDRPNLQLHVRLKSSEGIWANIGPILRRSTVGSTIIYCITRKQTEEIAQLLKSREIHCEAYHAGLSLSKRKEIHDQFFRDKLRVIVATIAFGMGIDKHDIRRIIHYGASRDIESYYQEIGRAGRDGIASECHMFYSHLDFQTHTSLQIAKNPAVSNQLDKLQMKMREYISTTECRRWFILEYFEGPREKPSSNDRCCDNCIRNLKEGTIHSKYEGVDENGCCDFAMDTELLLKSMDIFNGSTGLQTPLYFLRGSKNQKIQKHLYDHQLYGKGKNKSEHYWKSLANLLEEQGFLRRQNVKSANCFRIQTWLLTNKAIDWLENASGKPLRLKVPKDMYAFMKEKKQETCNRSTPILKPFTQERKPASMDGRVELVKALILQRIKLASEVNVMPYVVYSNRALYQLAKLKPLTMEAFKNEEIDGFSVTKAEKFGPRIIDCIKQTVKCLPETSNNDHRESVLEFLQKHPIEGFKVTAGNIAVYDLFCAGKNVKDISQIRGTTEGTVSIHMAALIKGGYLIKSDLLRLGVNEETFETITAKLRSVENVMNVKLNSLKEKCPRSITYDQLKYVVSYYQLEQHVQANGSDLLRLQQFGKTIGNLQGSNVEGGESSVECDIHYTTVKDNVHDDKTNQDDIVMHLERESPGASFAAQYFDDDLDFELSQIVVANTTSEQAVEQLVQHSECDVSQLDEVQSSGKTKGFMQSPEDEGEVELNKLILAIENDEKEEKKRLITKQNKQAGISNDSNFEMSSVTKKRLIKRKHGNMGKIRFVDDSSSDEDRSNEFKQQPKTLQEQPSAGRKMVKAFKCIDL